MMNPELIAKSLNFHGQPLQKIWEGERGISELNKLGLTNPDYTIYGTRQKTLTFQDRAKRLKLHQFISKKAPILFDSNLSQDLPTLKEKEDETNGISIIMPPYESLLPKSAERNKDITHILGVIQPGDIMYGMVTSRSASGLTIKALCTGEPTIRYLADLNLKAFILTQNLIPAHDKKGNPKPYTINAYVCCEVLDIVVDVERINLGMKGTIASNWKATLGPISAEQLPEYYKLTISKPDVSYEKLLESSKSFQNPNSAEIFFEYFDLNKTEPLSIMNSLLNRFPKQEYASELRQLQASKWAFRSVADGIEHFKVGRHSEAFQCLNKALNIDPRNVEGLVARGALYANSGSFKKAVDDFETALKLNPFHANARKYMGETLVALGRSYEEENRIDEAKKAYKDCLTIIPQHEEAKSSLEFLNGKIGNSKSLIDTNEFYFPGDDIGIDPFSKPKKSEERKEKHSKKKKVKLQKRKTSSRTSSSESRSSRSSASESSSSESSSSSSSGTDTSSSSKPKKKSKSEKSKQKSLSPLSKRMALLDEQNSTSNVKRYQFNQPFHLANAISSKIDDYDEKVRSFLDVTRDEEDYEYRVRKLVEEASKYRKEKKLDEKMRRKDKKKLKKLKKEAKKEKRKKERSKEKLDLDNLDKEELKEALKIIKSLPILDIESKLSADLAKYEKTIENIQRRAREVPSTSKLGLKQFKKVNSSDTENDNAIKNELNNQQTLLNNPYENYEKPIPELPETIKLQRPITPPIEPTSTTREKPHTPEIIKTLPPKPPIVLDKFGCFRLASYDNEKLAAIKKRSLTPRRSRYSRSRSRSRSRYRNRKISRSRSISRHRSRTSSIRRSYRRSLSCRRSNSRRRSYSRRSRSISPRQRHYRSRTPLRRRSRSFGRDKWRNSRSRSYSRSRSRSPLPWRRGGMRRGGPPFRGNRSFGYRGRGRGRGRGGFRGRRSPYFRPSPYNDRHNSPHHSRRGGAAGIDSDDEKDVLNNKKKSKKVDTNNSSGIEGKWTHDKYDKDIIKPENIKEENKIEEEENWESADTSVEEINKMVDKAQKERKEEIIQREKDILKKPTPTNLPF